MDAQANLYATFADAFPADRGRAFLTGPEGGSLSFQDLDTGSARLANLLLRLGVQPGDRVAVQVEKSAEAVLLYLAALRAGAVYLPLNTAYQRGELAYFLADAEPRVVVGTPAAAGLLRELADAVPAVAHVRTLGADGSGDLMEAAAGEADRFDTVYRSAGDLAAILYTSGTTGRSKGAMLSHGNLASNARALKHIWGFGDTDVLLHALPLFHVHGLFVALNTALLSAARLLFLPRFDADTVVRLLPQASVMMGVPTFYVRLLEHPGLDRALCRGMRLFVSGSAPLLPDTFAAWRERTGHTILERYGMTETGMNTSNPLQGERKPGAVGLPLPDVQVRIADPDGTPLPPGEVGMIEVNGPNVFSGYWRMPEKTAEEFRADGFFITGDVGRIDGDGYVHIVGRAKDLIISGGYNVYPKEVELLVDGLDGVAESAVVGVPHPDFGEAVVAVVRRLPGRDDVTAETVVRAARADLANYKVPKHVTFVEELPRNAMGKVQKNLLRQSLAGLFQPG